MTVQHERMHSEQGVAAVRQALGGPITDIGAWRTRVLQSLDELGRSFAAHVERSECPGGFLEETQTQSPRSTHALDEFRHDHARLDADLALARGTIDHVKNATDATDARHTVMATLRRVDEHLGAANRLTMDVANREFGGE